jgi:ribonuclease P protein component
VVRNRVRRRIREAYRLNEELFLPGWDIVIVARSRAVEVSFQKLTESLLSLSEAAGLLNKL